jgi:hypothetical protein
MERSQWRLRARSSRPPGRRKQGAHDGRQIRVVHMQAAERGLSSDSRGARTDPALPEPLARFRGPLLVSAASGTQIESAPMATKQNPRRGSFGANPRARIWAIAIVWETATRAEARTPLAACRALLSGVSRAQRMLHVDRVDAFDIAWCSL